MAVGMVAIAVAFKWIPFDLDSGEIETTGVTPAAIAVIVFIIWFVAFRCVCG